jgi:hypothetical protein
MGCTTDTMDVDQRLSAADISQTWRFAQATSDPSVVLGGRVAQGLGLVQRGVNGVPACHHGRNHAIGMPDGDQDIGH